MLTRSCPTTDLHSGSAQLNTRVLITRIHKDLKGLFPWCPSTTAALLCYYTKLYSHHIRRERKIVALQQGDEVSMERVRRARC